MTAHAPDRSDRVLAAVRMWHELYGHGPTIRDVARLSGLASPSAAVYHLRNLELAGRIEACGCGCRQMRVVEETA